MQTQNTSPQQLKDLQKAAGTLSAIRKTINFQKNASRLFAQGNWLLTPVMATDILRAAGVPISKDVQLTVATCQLIASGGAAVSAIEKNASLNAIAIPSVGAIQAFNEIAISLGWYKRDSPQAETIELGSDLALVVTSGGLNLLADIKAIFDIFKTLATHQLKLDSDTKKSAYTQLESILKAVIKKQSDAAARNFSDLQKGNISVFKFVVDIAKDSPEFFPQLFPEIDAFFPPTQTTEYKVETREIETFLGIKTGESAFVAYQSLITSRYANDFAKKFLKLFVDPVLYPYKSIVQLTKSELQALDKSLPKSQRLFGGDSSQIVPRISLGTLCVMSLLPPYFNQIPEKFGAVSWLRTWGLTPNDFAAVGGGILEQELSEKDSPLAVKEEKITESPVTMNGVDYFSQQMLNQNQRVDLRLSQRELYHLADYNGDIETLVKDPTILSLLNQWSNIVVRPYNANFTKNPATGLLEVSGSPKQSFFPLPQKDGTILNGMVRARNRIMNGEWRNIQNYFSALSLLNAFRKDIQDFKVTGYEWAFDDLDNIDSTYREVSRKMVYRKINEQAMRNIAQLLRVPRERLVKVNTDQKADEAAVFKVR